MSVIRQLKNLLNRNDKIFLLFLAFFSVFISLIETIGISAIMPFISIATDFNIIQTNKYYQWVYNFVSFNSQVGFIIAFGFILVVFYLIRGALNMLFFYLMARFSMGRYHIYATKLFNQYMNFYYQDFVTKNTSTLTKNIITEVSMLANLISATLFILSEVFVIIFLYSLMLYVHWKITLLFTLILIIKAIFLTKTVSKKIKSIGKIRAEVQKKLYEVLNSSFGNFKLIKLQKNHGIKEKFAKQSLALTRVNIINSTLANLPRLFLETMGFSLIILLLVYFIWQTGGNISFILPVVSLFVLALYRLLPSVNRIMTGYNQVLYYRQSLNIVSSDLAINTEKFGNEKINFNNCIELKNVNFSYKKNKPILKSISLVINKGDKVAFKGESGAGKSTLVDLIIGLYMPQNGDIKIDRVKLTKNNLKDWRNKIGYIPQHIYLFDGTVKDNVCFNREYDEQKVIKALKQANIYNFLQTKDGLNTLVGEGGIQLSGGQKQRIAIARALYGNPEILVLDEATSALDNETEQRIMDEIYKIAKDKTLIIIAHRLTTIKDCDKVYKVCNEGIRQTFNNS